MGTGKELPLSGKEVQDLKDILLSEPFKPEGISYALHLIKDSFLERINLNDSRAVRYDYSVLTPYELQMNAALEGKIFSDTGVYMGDGTLEYSERNLHVGVEQLLLARARRIATNGSVIDSIGFHIKDGLGLFVVDDSLRRDFRIRLMEYDFSHDGVERGMNYSGEETVFLSLLSEVYVNGKRQEQDSYSQTFP